MPDLSLLSAGELAGLVVQFGGNPNLQAQILKIFAGEPAKRKEVTTEVWWYVFRNLPRHLKNRVRPFLEERGEAVTVAA